MKEASFEGMKEVSKVALMAFLKRFLIILALLYLPAIYIIAAMALPHRLPISAGVVALAPYILGLVLLAFAMRKRRKA